MSKSDAEQPDELVIPLAKPVTLGDRSWQEITLREPTAGEMREIRKRDLGDQQIAAVAMIAGVPEQAVAKMPISAVERAEAYLVGFMSAARTTGGA